MKLKYPKEADDIIRKFYPTCGAMRTAKELEKISMRLLPAQVQQRARTLHVKSLRNGDDQVQRFKIGETVAIYRIKKFLGVKKTEALFVGSVRYLVRCVVCGYEEEKTQNGLYQSEQRDTKSCRTCARRERVEKEALEAEAKVIDAALLVKSYAQFMRDMPRVPAEYLPHSKRIDSQRSAQ